MKMPDGTFTACKNQQLRAILDEWTPIFQKFKVRKPKVQEFVGTFRPVMKSSAMACQDLTGPSLAAAARQTKPCAGSLDNWTPSAPTALAQWRPGVFDDLAAILNEVERTGVWPHDLTRGYTSLIPKSADGEEIGPLDFRPITVLSAVYRLWA